MQTHSVASPMTRRHDNLHDWLEAEHLQVYAADQQRHVSPVPQTWAPRTYYAVFEGVHGIARRDGQGACWFYADDGIMTLLHDCDIPALVLLACVEILAQEVH